MRTYRAEVFTAPLTHHGEGPMWTPSTGLLVLDMLAGDIVSVTEDGALDRRVHVDDVIAAIAPRRDGGLVAGTERGWCLLDSELTIQGRVEVWTDPAIRMNDGACDPYGAFWCGSMAYDLHPGRGGLWRFAPDDLSCELVLKRIGCSNGLQWTVDGDHAYYIDSLTGTVDRLRTTIDGHLMERTEFADLHGLGFPDGLAVDTEGGVWVALFGASRLIHLTPTGEIDGEITLPVRQVTACAFGGPDWRRLHITTSAHALEHPEPSAGAVYALDIPIGGFTPHCFNG